MAAAVPVRQGYRALKFDPFGHASFAQTTGELRRAVAIVAAVREAVGPDVRVALDAHGRFGLLSARHLLRALEPYDPFFVEEILQPQDARALAQLACQTSIPLALGERLYARREYQDLLEARLVPLIQPDVIHVGGILELRRIAAQAEAYNVGVAAHNAAGPISTAATLQAVAAMPNAQIQEMFAPLDAPWKDSLAYPPIEVVDGRVRIPRGPGLSIELDEEVARAHPGVPRSLAFYSDESMLEKRRE